jgi:S-adenosyl methyltransferase
VTGSGPTVYGVYDYWLGGVQRQRADRELGKAIAEEFPSFPAQVRAASDFCARVARYCAERDIARFIRAGAVTWQPEGRNVHEAARKVNPGARVVYVNRDAEAHEWALELLAGSPGVAAAHAPSCRPAEVLEAPPVAALLAGGLPVCLIIGMVLHFADAGEAAAAVAAYAAALPAGSVIAVSVTLPDNSPQADRLLSMFTPARIRRHTARDVRRWLKKGAGLKLVAPGVRDVRLVPGNGWASAQLPPRAPVLTVGTLGRKP